MNKIVRTKSPIGSKFSKIFFEHLYTGWTVVVTYIAVFRLDALAMSVIATATWLGGWVAGWLSHSGIVSKRQNVSENFFDHLKAPSF